MKYLVFIMFSVLILTGCRMKIQEYKMDKKNPTSYIFPTSIQKIHEILKKNYFGGDHILDFASDSSHWSWGEAFLTKPGNENDACLFQTNTSKVYFSKDDTVYQTVMSLIHITKIESNTTKVEIFTDESSINIEYNPYPQAFHAGISSKKVPPTTIEEYEILLKIGEELHMAYKMPKLILPEKIVIN
jgi:hypothetical protein